MAKKIVAGNWKMNKTFEEGLKLASEVINIANDEVSSDVTVVICPPFISLQSIGALTKGSKVKLGAQNVYAKASGAYTGEVSVEMLKSVGVEYVILGHSERREYFNETNALVAEKVKIALNNGITPIFCCGESLQQREKNIHIDFISTQLKESLFDLSEQDFGKIVIAYEPIWAIGTGVTATSAQAQEIHAIIRDVIAKKYNSTVASNTSILYGGSAKPDNAKELFANKDVDGGLIGGASLKARDFIDIVKSF